MKKEFVELDIKERLLLLRKLFGYDVSITVVVTNKNMFIARCESVHHFVDSDDDDENALGSLKFNRDASDKIRKSVYPEEKQNYYG